MRAIASCLFLDYVWRASGAARRTGRRSAGDGECADHQRHECAVLSLRINETLAYDTFSQGQRSGDAALPLLEATYEAEDRLSGTKAKSERITYAPGAYQSLVIVGDFSRTSPPGVLRQPENGLTGEEAGYPPNVLFQVYPHTSSKAPVRLRDYQRNARQTIGVCECKNKSPSTGRVRCAGGSTRKSSIHRTIGRRKNSFAHAPGRSDSKCDHRLLFEGGDAHLHAGVREQCRVPDYAR